ncbi:NAD(P)-dependent oxidoreductase [Streptomyces sporangiiformans]|uniref:NAD(P)-dependent oxidoreductase n=2 Tax=Streptomyces sporangiiformans TaxID=2315329 RepID=A0A505DPC8_9ACTN|nr:NAD(P)-binding domain-containing protein [Streptomyces sporangiiformans]TPQ23128.1 NAD(P)-dependent oxidoreductase [Streptomyces sporangiiformans]
MVRMPTDLETTSVDLEKTSVAVLGLGAMGQALAAALLRAGHPTTVWNRSAGKGDELVAQGAVRAATAGEAVRVAELVVVCVVDYDAAGTILESAADDLPGRVLVNLTSDTPERSRTTAAWANDRGIDYLDGAIMVPITMIGQPEALIFYSGPQAAYDKHAIALKALGGRPAYLGEDQGLAAVYDLALLDFFYGSITGMVHAFALAGADGVRATDLAPYLNTIAAILPPLAAGAARDIDAGSYPGEEANLGMMATAVDHILEWAEHRGLDVSTVRPIKDVYDKSVARGHAADSWTSTIEVVRGG